MKAAAVVVVVVVSTSIDNILRKRNSKKPFSQSTHKAPMQYLHSQSSRLCHIRTLEAQKQFNLG